MRWEFHPEARIEFRESANFYEGSRPGLGVALTNEIEAVLELIVEASERWLLIKADVRRCLARRFPFGVLYTIETDYVLNVGVMYCSRKPDYWQARLEN